MQIGKEKREGNKSSGEFSPMSCSFLGALSVTAGHFQGKAGRVKGSRSFTHYPLVFLRHESTGGGTGWGECWDGSVDRGARGH